MQIPPSGTQYPLAHGDFRAVVTEVGATLRSLSVRGEELLWGFDEHEPGPGAAGVSMAPWPNRVRDGAYRWEGEAYQLPVNEVLHNNAIHGLVHDVPWTLAARTDESVTLECVVHPRRFPEPSWPGALLVRVRYALDDDGLAVHFEAENCSDVPLPLGYGPHPYFAFPAIDDVEIRSPFTKQLTVDERLLPTGIVDVEDAADFREPRPLGDVVLDTAFTGVEGPWQLSLETEARTVEVWADGAFRWVQLFTHPTRGALAVEPMTCGPDALNEGVTHADLIRLEPGDRAQAAWGVRVVVPSGR